MAVLFTNNKAKSATPAQDQEYFDNFNWSAFEPGDTVYLEDYEAPDARARVAGIFYGLESDDPVIRMIPVAAAQRLASRAIEWDS